jgi:hypothetical protein
MFLSHMFVIIFSAGEVSFYHDFKRLALASGIFDHAWLPVTTEHIYGLARIEVTLTVFVRVRE